MATLVGRSKPALGGRPLDGGGFLKIMDGHGAAAPTVFAQLPDGLHRLADRLGDGRPDRISDQPRQVLAGDRLTHRF